MQIGTYVVADVNVLIEAALGEAVIVIASIIKESALDLLTVHPRAEYIDLAVFPGVLLQAYAL